MDFGSGSILVVSFDGLNFFQQLILDSFHLLDAYEETINRYFTWLFNFDCMEYVWSIPGYALRNSLASAAHVIFPRKLMLDTRQQESTLL